MLEVDEGCGMRLKRSASMFLALAAVAATALAASGAPAQATTPSYLFTVQAAGGSTAPGRTAPGENEHFTLTLRGVDPVTKFADRPFRTATVMTPGALVSNWNAWFASSAPNAVLTFADGTGRAPQSIVVTLSSPRYDNAGRTLTFTATRTYRSQDPGRKGKDWVRPATPRAFSSASLFIDDAGSSAAAPLVAELQAAMQPYVFAPNNAQLWSAVTAALSAVLTKAWQEGRLVGPTAASSYAVTCQPTANDIINGYLTCNVSMALLHPAEFYNTTVTQQQAN
jgi:hypothetical protein